MGYTVSMDNILALVQEMRSQMGEDALRLALIGVAMEHDMSTYSIDAALNSDRMLVIYEP